jgi:2-polyprenyl-3-methyl-5-hydroxy-6-metoxy-1,4-benzoquinol methylase
MAHIEQNEPINKMSESSYGKSYLTWKMWGDEFGKLSKFEAHYFSKEISKANCTFPKNSKVLEIGFGNGSFLKYASEKNWDVYGTEVNSDLVQIANQKGFNTFDTSDLTMFKNDTFDLVIAFDVLEHIPQEHLLSFILEIKRVLRNDGVLIARFPNGDSPFGLSNQNGDITHVTAIGSGKINYFAANSNMELIFSGGEAKPILGGRHTLFYSSGDCMAH